MDSLFKKYFWVIQVLGLAAATGLAASAIMTQLGTSFALDLSKDERSSSSASEDGEDLEDGDEEDGTNRPGLLGKGSFAASTSSTSSSSKRTEKKRVAESVLARNIFCPTCVPEEETVVDDAEPGAPGATSVNAPAGTKITGAAKSSLPLKLMATMEANDPAHSLATIYDGDQTRTGLYGIGDAIRTGVIVVGIEKAVVHLRNNARLEYIQIGEQVQVRPGRPEIAPPPEEIAPPSTTAIPGAEDAINCPTENNCVVERKFVEQLMANPAMLAKQARIVPSQRNGETQGFKFYGIRRDSLPRMLGLKNGDMLTSVNGEELKSVDQAMGLALKLRRASNLSVTLVRKGETISKEIQIQ